MLATQRIVMYSYRFFLVPEFSGRIKGNLHRHGFAGLNRLAAEVRDGTAAGAISRGNDQGRFSVVGVGKIVRHHLVHLHHAKIMNRVGKIQRRLLRRRNRVQPIGCAGVVHQACRQLCRFSLWRLPRTAGCQQKAQRKHIRL